MDAHTELADRISRYDWFHTIDFGDGIVTKGHCAADILRAKADCYFSTTPVRKSVLDIGCWDGYFSLEALRRGASRVLATDHHVWHGEWGRGAFDLVREHLAPNLEVKDIDIYDISPATIGTFDIVLFTGVLYHARHPLLALERAASVCAGTLVVETVLDVTDVARPAMVFYPGPELRMTRRAGGGRTVLVSRPCCATLASGIFASRPPRSRGNGRFSTGSSKTRTSPRVASFTPAASTSRADFPLIPVCRRSDMLHCDGLGPADCIG